MILEYYLYYIYYSFLGMPFVMRVSILALILFVPVYLFGCFTFLRFRGKYYKEIKNRIEFDNIYRERLCDIITSANHLVTDDFDKLLDSGIKKLNKKEKKILTQLLASIYQDVQFINYENNQNLLDYLKIRQFWEKKLKNGSVYQKQNSLRRLDDLQSKISGAVLTELTYNQNQFLRKRSRYSYLKSINNDPFKFMEENFDESLNNWDKIELHHILKNWAKTGRLPSFARWVLHSDNLDFRCFMVDEIAFFNQHENASILVQLIKEVETSSELRLHCINALGKMRYCDAERELLKIYHVQPKHIQHAIIQTIGKLATGKALPFLIDAYKKAIDNERRITTLSAIYNYNAEGKEYFDAMLEKESTGNFSYLIFKHVSNPLLSTY